MLYINVAVFISYTIGYVQSDVKVLYDGQIDTAVSYTTATQRPYSDYANWLF